MSNYSSILISGPTASGKSQLAVRLAKIYDGVVINADAMQIYDVLSIITARPNIKSQDGVPHFLYGYVNPQIRYSVGEWQKDIARLLVFLEKINILPIIVGGTGLYFSGLLGEIAEIPNISQEIRSKWLKVKDENDTHYIHEYLKKIDPKSYKKINPNDPSRILRAIEVYEQTGVSIQDWQENAGIRLIEKSKSKFIYLCPNKDDLHFNIENRTAKMLSSEELYREVSDLRKLRVPSAYPLMKAIGVREVIDLIDGKTNQDQVKISINNQTKRYVKRQITWARKKMVDWNWIDDEKQISELL
ncbi:MAG: tRNA (adenosine(37)-N6)-dimethylallyltransferase MiaA [Pseudomonadota bacterium]|nr:tRNA (adenosine(37)-N6)-dimethylallyltransferase MiaA [Pseudomonadota bacterium]